MSGRDRHSVSMLSALALLTVLWPVRKTLIFRKYTLKCLGVKGHCEMVQEEIIYIFYIYRSTERAIYPSESLVSEYMHVCVCRGCVWKKETERYPW